MARLRSQAKSPAETPKTRERNEKLRDFDPAVLVGLRDQVRKTKRGMKAPLAAIKAVEGATRLAFEDGCRLEAELFYECLSSTESKSLIHAFFGERTVSKVPGLSKDAKLREIGRAATTIAGRAVADAISSNTSSLNDIIYTGMGSRRGVVVRCSTPIQSD